MFQPVVPFSGYSGWAVLTRTLDTQKEAYEKSPVIQRETDYFKENIGKVSTAEDLVADRTLLKVALGAFGLDADINSKAFIRKILSDGTLTSDALANKLSDKRYLDFAKAFGFGDFSVPRTKLSGFGDEITSRYTDQQFEVAIGDADPDMRLALGLQRDLTTIAEKSNSVDTKWYTIMGQPPLRKVFETALGLPSSFGAQKLETQLKTFKARAEQVFGSDDLAQFSEPAKREDLVRIFLLRADIQASSSANIRGQTALALLQGSGGGLDASLLIG